MKNRGFKDFKNSQDGAIAIIIAISLVALLFGVMALSIDMNRSQTSYVNMQGSTDAAALSTAEWILKKKIENFSKSKGAWNPSNSQMKDYAEKVLLQNFNQDNQTATYDKSSLDVDYDIIPKPSTPNEAVEYRIKVTACADLSTKVADAAEMTDEESDKDTRVCTTSTAAFDLGKLKDTEVAFALDFTESMFWRGESQNCVLKPNSCPAFEDTKAYNFVKTMNKVLDTYFSDLPSSTAFASLVPFSGIVNLYPYNSSFVSSTPKVFQFKPNGNSIYVIPPMENKKGKSFANRDDISRFGIFYTNKNYATQANSTPELNTTDYKYVLDRIPAFDEGIYNRLIDETKNSSAVKFKNYGDVIESLKAESFINSNADFDSVFKFFNGTASLDRSETIRMSYCYMGGIGAALDQRIERVENPLNNTSLTTKELDGVVESAEWVRKNINSDEVDSTTHHVAPNAKRYVELRESFPIQPLTNNLSLLKGTFGRFIADTSLYGTNSNYVPEDVVDRQTSPLNKSRDFSALNNTQSVQGLMWAWLTIAKNWSGKWSNPSLNENYFSSFGSASRASRVSNSLPKDSNTKHIILLTDGFDIDGIPSITGPYDQSGTNRPEGFNEVCDGYIPAERFSDDKYVELCKRIKKDNIKIHIVIYGIDPTQVTNAKK